MPLPVATLVVPAHNEAAVIGRLLRGLLDGADPGEFSIVVVANGCTDATASVASGFGADVTVLETPVPSKAAALRLGDEAASGFPRLYVDADVELTAAGVRVLAAALERSGTHAAAPERALDLVNVSWPVSWYYDVWTRLPSVRDGLFGRGVIAVDAQGCERLAALPSVMADDLAASIAFSVSERAVVPEARVGIRPPRTFADLMRRRVRAVTSVTEVEGRDDMPAAPRTGLSDLVRLLRAEPALAPKVVLFAAVALLAKARARRAVRRGDYLTWLRDESSRQPGHESERQPGHHVERQPGQQAGHRTGTGEA
ncbi:glycosyltransferase [Sphaerisporangium sp. NPDC088356]|uniref:glycosyltransferase n=1 Tax=Sphaerisporangium sp. NPDC088356 TaxID=3154871 RepID=UPI00343CA160